MDFTPYIGAIVTAAVFIIGSYVAMKNANNQQFQELKVDMARVETKVDDLKETVDKHNHVVEKVAVNSRDIKTAFNKIDELSKRDEKLEQRIQQLHGM